MKLAIVGAVILKDSPHEVKDIIRSEINRLKPTEIISGGAEGVDTFAEEVANELGLKKTIFLPEKKCWEFFKKRNIQIANECDQLLRIASDRSKTYGSGWTRDRAVEMGKPTKEFRLP